MPPVRCERRAARPFANRIVVGNFVADHEEIDGFDGPDSPNSGQAIAVYHEARVTLYV
jgi:hypothetical protein